ncbi:MAG TPA: 3-dehydroquinate synthase [Xanthobacteraceae bacterium]|nr:3-dehydroquinate synthase [Xanthobacteraceae bacterium]
MIVAADHHRPILVDVALGERRYDLMIGRGLLAELGTLVKARRPHAAVALVTDTVVASHHLAAAQAALTAARVRTTPVVIPSGEASKSWDGLKELCEALLSARIERGDLVIALGGGVVGDLAGFAAAILRRGVDVVQVPTSLLAQVDSAVGGKTGINAARGKNLIGAFHQPILVVADTALLDTLPARDFRSGYAEMVKYGLINDRGFFDWLEEHWRAVFAATPERDEAVAQSCRAKAAIVMRDEREAGERALLNLGHTFGHALETATGYSERLLHGEAVAIGMSLALAFSVELGLLPADEAARVDRHLAAVGLPTKLSAIAGGIGGADALVGLMAEDKKVKQGQLTLILSRGIGASLVRSGIDPGVLRAFLAEKLAEP